MMLVAEGAEQFAKANDIALCNPKELIAPAEREAWQHCKKDQHAAEHHRGHEQGTVGAVALDSHGALFAATSTGGTCCKLPGRVGDSPLIGCGCYADSEAGAASATGYGEAIMKIVMSKYAVDLLRHPGPATSISVGEAQNAAPQPGKLSSVADSSSSASAATQAAQSTVALLAAKTKATGGLILLDRDGHPAFAFNTPRMAYGYVAPDGSFLTSV